MDYWNGLLDWTTGMDYWYGLLVWTTGMDHWYGLLVWTTGLDYWYGIALKIIFMAYDEIPLPVKLHPSLDQSVLVSSISLHSSSSRL